jgi:hypothetical protein
MLNVLYTVPLMLSVAYKPFMLSVVMISVIMLSVLAPKCCTHAESYHFWRHDTRHNDKQHNVRALLCSVVLMLSVIDADGHK